MSVEGLPMPSIQLDLKKHQMLLADWFVCLARESGIDLSKRSSSGQAITVGDPSGFHVIAHFTEKPPFLKFLASDTSRQNLVDDIVAKAVAHVERGDFGGIVWYSTKLNEVEVRFPPLSLMSPFLQRLGSQTRIAGWRRLGISILLEFVEEVPEDWAEKKPILAPKAVVDVNIAAPGPCAGYFSSHIAHGVVETVQAICAFALGRSVELPHTVFPFEDEKLPELNKRRGDPAILTLARKGTSLDIFTPLAADGGLELFRRVRAALITFDAATRQDHDSVAAILYIVVVECLVTPYTDWRRERVTKRFIEFFDELIPDDLDQIVAHGNFEEAFGMRRGARTARALRREVLDRMYDYRSGQLHKGLEPSYQGLGGVGVDVGSSARRGLLGDFAEAAVLRYLSAPRSSLIGHPEFEGTQGCHCMSNG